VFRLKLPFSLPQLLSFRLARGKTEKRSFYRFSYSRRQVHVHALTDAIEQILSQNPFSHRRSHDSHQRWDEVSKKKKIPVKPESKPDARPKGRAEKEGVIQKKEGGKRRRRLIYHKLVFFCFVSGGVYSQSEDGGKEVRREREIWQATGTTEASLPSFIPPTRLLIL
jgi:hypothetical protein